MKKLTWWLILSNFELIDYSDSIVIREKAYSTEIASISKTEPMTLIQLSELIYKIENFNSWRHDIANRPNLSSGDAGLL